MLNVLTRLFGSRNERLVRGYGRLVRAANELEPQIQALSDEALRWIIDMPPAGADGPTGLRFNHSATAPVVREFELWEYAFSEQDESE